MEIRKDTDSGARKGSFKKEENRSESYSLEEDILNHSNADTITMALVKHVSKNKNVNAFSSAVSMINFYMNRAGNYLPDSQREVLERVKIKLREYYRRHESW